MVTVTSEPATMAPATNANAAEEMQHAVEFKYAIINNNFDDALLDLRAVVRAERLAIARQLARHPEVFIPVP